MSTVDAGAACGRAPRAVATLGGAPAERRQRVRLPWRLVESAFYADVALSVYMKIKALGARPEGCTAGAATLASYLGMSKASVERGLAQLRRPAPDGVVELPENVRRSLPGGSGTTARRRVRAMSSTERFVWLPVAACEDLTPRQLRAYAVLMYAQKQQIPLALGEIAGFLRHFSGQRAGLPITTEAAGTVIDELEAAGWATVARRAGAQGRHHYIAHEIPPVTAGQHDAEAARTADGGVDNPRTNGAPVGMSPGVDEGSGAGSGEGSLATKEDHGIVRPDDERAPSLPAVGEVQVGEAVENRVAAAAFPTASGGLALRAGEKNSSSRPSSSTGPAQPHGLAYGGPELTFSPRVHAVLEPVHWLVQQINSVWVLRKIGREIGRQLDHGVDASRLRHRLTVRLAGVLVSEIRDPGRWLLGAALPRWGCGHFDCESGVMWSTGAPCVVCQDALIAKRAERQRQQRLDQGLCPEHGTRTSAAGRCYDCEPDGDMGAMSRPVPQPREQEGTPQGVCRVCGSWILSEDAALRDGFCPPCRESAHVVPTGCDLEAPEQLTCAGWGGQSCNRLALPTRTVCVRHRAAQLATAAAS
ncbi:hypothetical protein [Streptomyces syringium]|uniref:hypothetical protein n=1 Tax=Streptomyces syringium TaxID=76729 RepID=UPI003403D036